jgi:hypothetical protein
VEKNDCRHPCPAWHRVSLRDASAPDQTALIMHIIESLKIATNSVTDHCYVSTTPVASYTSLPDLFFSHPIHRNTQPVNDPSGTVLFNNAFIPPCKSESAYSA